MTFGENLVNLRKRNGVSQEQLAEVLGITRQTISKWELNQSTPDLQYIVQIGEYFNVSLDYLIKGEEITLAKVSKQEKEDDCDKKSNYVIGYKWIFVLGLVLVVVSMVGMMTFAVCAAIRPHEYGIDDRVYNGLAGFLRGTQSQGIFAVLNLLFLSGIGCAGWGISNEVLLRHNVDNLSEDEVGKK